VEIVPVTAAATRPLRRAILRPHQAEHELVYPGDDDPQAFHATAVAAGEVVGVASVAPEAHSSDPRPGDWRLRGMATVPAVRGTGAGQALLDACVAAAGARGARRVWCTARVPAAGFYERFGFAVEGDVFEVPMIGPHVVMSREL
jgi:GNAT superfamily N-acetyltransferase